MHRDGETEILQPFDVLDQVTLRRIAEIQALELMQKARPKFFNHGLLELIVRPRRKRMYNAIDRNLNLVDTLLGSIDLP